MNKRKMWVSFRNESKGNSLEKEMATQSSVLAWSIPWAVELVGCHQWGCKECGMSKQVNNNFHTQQIELWKRNLASNFPPADSSVGIFSPLCKKNASSCLWNKVLKPKTLHKSASAWHQPLFIPYVPVILAGFLFTKCLPASEPAHRLFSLPATFFHFPPCQC